MTKNIHTLILKFLVMSMLIFTSQVMAEDENATFDDDEELFEMSIEQLMEVEVESTATLTDAKPRLVPAAVTKITAEQIRLSGARSLYELLDIHVPNLQWLRHHWEADVIGLRGIINDRNDKLLLLVNGRNMNHRTHFGALSELDLVLLSDIHHIDIVRGPGSAMYGPGAVSMVINIITHNAGTFEGTEYVTRMGAVEEFYTGEVKHGQKFDDGGIFLYGGIGEYSGATKYDAPQIYAIDFPTSSDYPWSGSPPPQHGPPVGSLPGDGILEGEPVKHLPLNRDGESARNLPPVKTYAQIKKGNWDFWARYTRGGKQFVWSARPLFRHPAGWEEWNNMWWINDTSTPVEMNPCFYAYQQATGYIGYQQELNKNTNVDYAFSYDMIDFERFANNIIFDAFREDEYYGRVLLQWDPNGPHKIAVGTEVSHLELGLNSPGWPDKNPILQGSSMSRWSTNLYSILGEHQWNINDRWTTFVGARLDDHSYTALMFSPRAAVVHTPNERDTWKLLWSRSVRSNFEEEMKAQSKDPNSGENSDPEVLDSVELRFERQHSQNLDLAASAFVHYNLEIISWDGEACVPVGTQRDYGVEVEACYHTERTRLVVSHGFTKLYDFHLEHGQNTYITTEPYGIGNDLTNWSNHITKITAQHKLNDQWTADASLRFYWGYPGMRHYDDYYLVSNGNPGQTYGDGTPYPTYHPLVAQGWRRAYRGNVYLNIGLHCQPSKNVTFGIVGYNLLGIFNKDFNKRNYLAVAGEGDFRSHAAAVGAYANIRTK